MTKRERTDLLGRRVVVVGLGVSGVAAARFCAARGARVLGTDQRPLDELSLAAQRLGIEFFLGNPGAATVEDADLVIVSPGVPPLPSLVAAERAGVEVLSELELASRFLEVPIVAVGGTNGKSTTTRLVGALLEASGRQVFVGGNLGTPLVEALGASMEVAVVEVSSFQLERAPTFTPHVSLLLNITEDHLDRYRTLSEYAAAKGNAFVHQGPADVAIVPAGDALCREQAERGAARVVSFGSRADGAHYFAESGSIVERESGQAFPMGSLALSGAHNRKNAAAALAAARSFEVSADAIEHGFAGFRPLPHRMQMLGKLRDVAFYDDSKATNVGAAVTALLGLEEERAVLIAGGRDKLGDFGPLVRALAQKGRAAVLIGEASGRLSDAIGGTVRQAHAATLESAVSLAFELAHPGDAVLLSPACSSFDMFSSYVERGLCFQSAVAGLRYREGAA